MLYFPRLIVRIKSTIPVHAGSVEEALHLAKRRDPYDIAEYFIRFTPVEPSIRSEVILNSNVKSRACDCGCTY